MSLLSSIKPFLPFLLTFLIPRCLSYYRALKIAIKTRPPPRPLPAKTSRSLNILFVSTCLFLFLSFPSSYSSSSQSNIFAITNSRFNIPTDVLFTRLALLRPLTPFDESLREKITTPITRSLYLTYGPQTLLTCPFCTPHQPLTYTLHHLPTYILPYHLLHLFLLGLATTNPATHKFRTKLVLSALALAVSDIYLSTIYPSTTAPNPPHLTPQGIYWLSQTLRPLCLALHDLLASGLIYVTLTNRLPFPPPLGGATSLNSASDAESKHNQLRALTQSTLALQTALTKLRAYTVARSAVVRDPGLKGREDGYWRVVVGMEGPSREARPRAREGVDDGMGDGGGESGSIWEEEEVMQAMADVTMRRMGGGGGGVDVERVRREAEAFVEGVLAGLDLDVEDERQEEVR